MCLKARVVLHVTPVQYQTVQVLWVTPRKMSEFYNPQWRYSSLTGIKAPIFVTSDCVAFLIQVFGGIQSASSDANKKMTGFTVMKIGLAVQLLCFGLFLVISFRFHIVAKRFRDAWADTQWVEFLWAINISCLLIFVSTILLNIRRI